MNTEEGLKEFVAQMKRTLDAHQADKGDSWVTCDIRFLMRKFGEETREYFDAENDMECAKELVDIANVCMMLYHRHIEAAAKQATEKKFGKQEDEML